MDQKFIKGRNIFQNISQLVDEILPNYIRRQGFLEPLLAQFCNGTTSTFAGMSQWGSETLAQQGYSYWDILVEYYGENIEMVTDAEMRTFEPSYPDPPLRKGSTGEYIFALQNWINRIARAYPLIPTIWPETGVFDESTEESVKAFQSIFNLTPDGIVGKATWNKLLVLYTGITKLSELVSEGQAHIERPFVDSGYVTIGDKGDAVARLQYIINILSAFNDAIPSVDVDAIFGEATRQAVIAFQKDQGLIPNGIVDTETWASMLDQYAGIKDTVLDNVNLFPTEQILEGNLTTEEIQSILETQNLNYPNTTTG